MTTGKMHADEVDTDASLVRRLLAAQFPQWADLPIAPVSSAGTDNALYRLGDDLVVRLPRIESAIEGVEKEQRWLPRLAPRLPLAIPAPLAIGTPGMGYPWRWSIYRWLDGETADVAPFTDLTQVAAELARFIVALRQVDSTGGPHANRGLPLASRDAETRAAIADLWDMIDTDAATVAWEAALRAPVWEGPPTWFHGDLLPGNLLIHGGRLSAVIDFGSAGVGDPTCDVMVAWAFFAGEAREVFRATLAVDDATWARGAGWALSWGLIALPYYKTSNPILAGIALRAINEAIADHRAL